MDRKLMINDKTYQHIQHYFVNFIILFTEQFSTQFYITLPSSVPKYNIWENSGEFLGPFNHSFFKVWKLEIDFSEF